MAIQHLARAGELITFDPGDPRGPWQITMPAYPSNGDRISLRAMTRDPTVVRLDTAGGTAEFEDPRLGGRVPDIDVTFDGGAIDIVYNGADMPEPAEPGTPRDAWIIYANFIVLDDFQPVSTSGKPLMAERLAITQKNKIPDLSRPPAIGTAVRLFIHGQGYGANTTPGLFYDNSNPPGQHFTWSAATTGVDIEPGAEVVAVYFLDSWHIVETLQVVGSNTLAPLQELPAGTRVSLYVNGKRFITNVSTGVTLAAMSKEIQWDDAIIGIVLTPFDYVEAEYALPQGGWEDEKLVITEINEVPPLTVDRIENTVALLTVNGRTHVANFSDGVTIEGHQFHWNETQTTYALNPDDEVIASVMCLPGAVGGAAPMKLSAVSQGQP